MLLLYARVGKSRDPPAGGESPAGAGAGRGASHKTASLVTPLSRHGAAIAYTDLLCRRAIIVFVMLYSYLIEKLNI